MSVRQKHNLQRPGTSLIEIVVAVGIFAIIAVSFAQTLMLSAAQVADSRLRMTAVAIANQQMEQLRNLPYDDVAVVGGVPAGTIPAQIAVTEGGRTFDVQTDIRYVDDAFDGTIDTSPADAVPNDYKNVRIDVSWGDAATAHRVRLESRFVPPGIELATGGGTLAINVFDAEGQALPNAAVTVTNTTVSPHVAISAFSDTSGRVLVPGAPAGSGYAITVAKSGYESVRTYPPYPTTAFHPADQDATVVAATLTAQGIVSGRMATATLRTVSPHNATIEHVDLHVTGGRVLGTATDGSDVYDVTLDGNSDAGGTYALGSRPPGTYVVTVQDAAYRLVDVTDTTTPGNDTFALSQGVTRTIDVIVADTSVPSLLVIAANAATGDRIAGASVHVTGNGYDATIVADAYGQAYFPASDTAPLTAGTYTVDVTATGFSPAASQNVAVTGLTDVAATMTAL